MASSDEEFRDDSDIDDDDDDVARHWRGESEADKRLSMDGSNVGKSLRRVSTAADDEQVEVVKKARVFDESAQLPLGARTKISLPRFEQDDDGEDIDDEEAESEEDDELEGPVVVKSTTVAKPLHVRNQRKNESDIVGVRIRLQGLVNLLGKLPSESKVPNRTSDLREIVLSLVTIRNIMLENGSLGASAKGEPTIIDEEASLDDLWLRIKSIDEKLWSVHRTSIDTWERRAHLATSKGKALRAMNKGAIEQMEAVLARRAETGNEVSDFAKEDSEFYQQLLRDFVQARSADAAPAFKNVSDQKRKQYLEKQRSKEPRISYDVHEKMINFLTPVTIPAPNVDIDQLIKSLFRS